MRRAAQRQVMTDRPKEEEPRDDVRAGHEEEERAKHRRQQRVNHAPAPVLGEVLGERRPHQLDGAVPGHAIGMHQARVAVLPQLPEEPLLRDGLRDTTHDGAPQPAANRIGLPAVAPAPFFVRFRQGRPEPGDLPLPPGRRRRGWLRDADGIVVRRFAVELVAGFAHGHEKHVQGHRIQRRIRAGAGGFAAGRTGLPASVQAATRADTSALAESFRRRSRTGRTPAKKAAK